MSDAVKIGLLGVVVALAIAAFWWFGRDAASVELGAGRVEAHEIDEAPGEIVIPRRVSDRSAPVPDLREEDMPAELREATETAEGAIGGEATITIVLSGPDGEPWPERDGELKLQCREREESAVEYLRVEVENGVARFELTERINIVAAESMRVGAASRLARNPQGPMFERADLLRGTCKASLRIVPRIDLQVLDADDRRPLRRVRVLRPKSWDFEERQPASFEDMRLVAEGDSPLPIDVLEYGTHSPYWVVVPDHAAARLHLDQHSEGERLVLVEAGGRLEAEIIGDPRGVPAPLMPKLRLRDAQARNDYELVSQASWDGRRRADWSNLPVGDYRLSLESGEVWHAPVVLAEKELRIEARKTTKVRLDADCSPLRVDLVEVSGRIVLPAGGLAEAHVQILIGLAEPQERHPKSRAWVRCSRDVSEPALLRFGPVELVPGAYRATLLGQSFDFDVPAGGRDDLVFELAAREVVEIVLRIEGEDEPIDNAHVSWHGGGRNGDATWNTGRRAYLASPPEGPISFMIWFGDSFRQAEIERAAGQSRIELTLRPSQAFTLILKCGDVVIPHSFDLPIAIETEDGKAVAIRSASSDGESVQRDLDSPGRYRVTLQEAPAGYRAKGPVSFEVKAGETREVIMELVVDR